MDGCRLGYSLRWLGSFTASGSGDPLDRLVRAFTYAFEISLFRALSHPFHIHFFSVIYCFIYALPLFRYMKINKTFESAVLLNQSFKYNLVQNIRV